MISINGALVISAENIQNLRVFGFIKGEINGAIKACGRRVTAFSIPVPTAPFPSKMRNHKIEVKAKLSAVIFTILETNRKVSLPHSGATIHSSKNHPYKNPSFLQTLTKAYPIFGFLVNVREK